MSSDNQQKECCNIKLIIAENYNEVRRYLVSKTGNPELSEDIIQEAMVKLVNAYNRGIYLQNPKGWLFEIARNSLADHYRKACIVEKNETVAFSDNLMINHEDINPSTEDFIVPMIKLLSARYSEPLYLSDIENIPLKDIGIKLGISLSATKMRVQRARKMLLTLFHECCEIEYTKSGAFSHCTIKDSCLPLSETARFNSK